jgi:imidazolonepropionase-like amidohydrolase
MFIVTPLVLAAVLTLTHITVIDVVHGRIRPNATVRIESDSSQTIDARGKFLIPGLWDMHTHVPDDVVGRDAYLPLFVANGVTGIRVMEGSPELYRWRDAVARGEIFGPRMVVASPIIDGRQSFLPDAVKVATADEARAAVRNAKRSGADFIKVYDSLSPEEYSAIIEESRHEKLPVAGHVPRSVGVADVSRAGQTTIEHMMGIAAAARDARSRSTLFRLLRRNQTWECPTLIMRHNYAYLDDARLAKDVRLAYVRRSTRRRWVGMIGQGTAQRKATFAAERRLVGRMAAAGVGLLAGTDNGNPFCFPGFSLHDELALLVDAGLSPLQALRSATINPARLLQIRGTGDFVILDANPLEDIRNTKRIRAVIMRGRILNREALDALLQGARMAVEASAE